MGINETLVAINALSTNIDGMSDACVANVIPAVASLTDFGSDITELLTDLNTFDEFTQCTRVNKLYVSLVHDTICNDVANGLGHSAICLMMMTIGCVGVIFLRASWMTYKPCEEDSYYQKEMPPAYVPVQARTYSSLQSSGPSYRSHTTSNSWT
uniref:Uncharacterized protein n=1 Tax=Proboscia inermis TaxID=420281 RepID=A0A7S0GNX2_9STRA|mmetsp:Transcript_8751/g.8874  ORF Transcript_8751/g.8874 Transcript_8751/m.8874 type:complete len:154 (+) Transcript_8751:130-591(+)